MKDRSILEQLRTAEAELGEACTHLTSASPQDLEKCSLTLAATVERLRGCLDSAAGSRHDPKARDAARRLRRSVLMAKRLLECAAVFYQTWQLQLDAMSLGYSASGRPVPIERGCSVRLEA